MSLAHSFGESSTNLQPDAVILQFRRRPEVSYRKSMKNAQRFGELASWTFAYIDYIYQNGDYRGRSMPMEGNPITWRTSEHAPVIVKAEARGREAFCGRGNTKPGALFVITHAFDGNEERLELESDGYRVINGSYSWVGDETLRPAADVDFGGVLAANRAGVASRSAEILGDFKGKASNICSGLEMRGVWNTALPMMPPPTVVGRYVTPD